MDAGLGMNAVRVFLHDLAWSVDPPGFLGRLDRFLSAAASRGIRTLPLLRKAFTWARQIAPSQPLKTPVWFHDVLRPDGTAFDEAEVAAIRRETAAARSARP